jgi:putative intracellular protease/amidase
VCSGAFILAETGLVAGRSVSTHRICAEALAKRFRRGLSGAGDEFHLAAIVQNLKTLANYIWRPLLNIPVACVA